METGQTFQGRFRVQYEVGRGSFGVVYRVEDLTTGEPRAVKLLLPWAQHDAALRRRLQREARYSRSFRSPHMVRIEEVAETREGDLYTVMEFVEGRELSDVLRAEGRLSPQRVTRIAEQALDALAEAHAAGVIHRDLKPHNILLGRDAEGNDSIKIFDFGIATVSEESILRSTELAKLTMAGGVLGTPAYMSPEQCHGEELTPASDLYSMGIVLYELLTGHVPFEDSSPLQVMLMHAAHRVPPLPDDLADTPLGRAVMRALEKDPQRRFATADEFRAALSGEQPPSPAAARNGKTVAPPPLPTTVEPPRPAPAPLPHTTPRPKHSLIARGAAAVARHWVLLAILALIALIIASQLW